MTKELNASLDDVVQQLKINNYLLAIMLKHDDKVGANEIEHDLIIRLDAAKVSHVYIAELLGKTPNSIDVILSRERHKEKVSEPDAKKKV